MSCRSSAPKRTSVPFGGHPRFERRPGRCGCRRGRPIATSESVRPAYPELDYIPCSGSTIININSCLLGLTSQELTHIVVVYPTHVSDKNGDSLPAPYLPVHAASDLVFRLVSLRKPSHTEEYNEVRRGREAEGFASGEWRLGRPHDKGLAHKRGHRTQYRNEFDEQSRWWVKFTIGPLPQSRYFHTSEPTGSAFVELDVLAPLRV